MYRVLQKNMALPSRFTSHIEKPSAFGPKQQSRQVVRLPLPEVEAELDHDQSFQIYQSVSTRNQEILGFPVSSAVTCPTALLSVFRLLALFTYGWCQKRRHTRSNSETTTFSCQNFSIIFIAAAFSLPPKVLIIMHMQQRRMGKDKNKIRPRRACTNFPDVCVISTGSSALAAAVRCTFLLLSVVFSSHSRRERERKHVQLRKIILFFSLWHTFLSVVT